MFILREQEDDFKDSVITGGDKEKFRKEDDEGIITNEICNCAVKDNIPENFKLACKDPTNYCWGEATRSEINNNYKIEAENIRSNGAVQRILYEIKTKMDKKLMKNHMEVNVRRNERTN
jgi:hypothetical protein